MTGSTDGIGKAYAFELARKGFDLVLISRTQSKLDDTANEIKQQYRVEIKTIAFDFSNPNLFDYQNKVLSQLEKLEVGVLSRCFSKFKLTLIYVQSTMSACLMNIRSDWIVWTADFNESLILPSSILFQQLFFPLQSLVKWSLATRVSLSMFLQAPRTIHSFIGLSIRQQRSVILI